MADVVFGAFAWRFRYDDFKTSTNISFQSQNLEDSVYNMDAEKQTQAVMLQVC